MDILVVGSVALDTVRTPFGEAVEVLGGSATYFSVAAGFFAPVKVVGVVGEDFPEKHLSFLRNRSIDLCGLKRTPGRTFRWVGEYGYDLSEAKTLETQLNVFADFDPEIPEGYRESEIVFLANIDPDLQRKVLHQIKGPMSYWIQGRFESLLETLKEVQIVLINESEVRQLAREANLVRAARKILSWGPSCLVVKRGEYGALMFSDEVWFAAPAYPLEDVFDPTGAGDCFAGGFLGYLAQASDFGESHLRRAMIMGSVLASFNVEDFSLNRLRTLTYKEIEARYQQFRKLAHFEDLSR